MADIEVGVDIDASPQQVWGELQHIDRHVEWMRDAVAIRFVGEQTSGVGTEFFCDTKVWPFKLVDHMTITEWVPATTMGVRHTGLITGVGKFTLTAIDDGHAGDNARTHFGWQETLKFPWWFGGQIGAAVVSRAVLRPIWKRNLRALKTRIESSN